MINLSNKLIKEIVENSNHKDEASVKAFIYNGDIEIYKNKDEYEEAGYDLSDERFYIVLSNGYVTHFIGG